jgi:hypothetical protein
MKTRYAIAPPIYLGAAALLVVGCTLYFAHYTATNAYHFPRFLLALPLFVYFPGRFLVDSLRLQVRTLDHLTLSLVLGLLASSVTYWIAMRLGVPLLFLLFSLSALTVCVYRAIRQWKPPGDWTLSLDRSHLLLLGVLALAVGLLAVVPIYYRNMISRSDGGIRYRTIPDVTLHMSLSQELTHTVPPQSPFFSGTPLSYHYAADIPAAFFSMFAGLSVMDLTVRFIPTFYFVMTILAIFSFSRAWLSSGGAAALCALLVILGEDFAFIPGLWQNSHMYWCSQYFGTPTTFSLYYMNPMLPAVGVFFAGLFCMLNYFREGRSNWLCLTALFFAACLEYKLFITAQVLLALGICSLLYLFVFRDRRPLILLSLTVAFVSVLAVPMRMANASAAHLTVRLQTIQALAEFVRQINMSDTDLGKPVVDLLNSGVFTLKGLAICLFVLLPIFLLGTMGGRIIGLRRILKDLFVPTPQSSSRFFLALFVFLGPLLSLTCAIVSADRPTSAQYNNSVWFLVLSKYIAWIFAVEALCGAFWLRHRRLQAAAAVLLVALAVPSTVQFIMVFCEKDNTASDMYEQNKVEVLAFLESQRATGQVTAVRHEDGVPLYSLTTVRTPITTLAYIAYLAPTAEIEKRDEEWKSFWNMWQRGEVCATTLRQYQVRYLILDKEGGRTDPGGIAYEKWYETGTIKVRLHRCFENDGFVVYQVSSEAGSPQVVTLP